MKKLTLQQSIDHIQKVSFAQLLATILASILVVVIFLMYQVRADIVRGQEMIPNYQSSDSNVNGDLILSEETSNQIYTFAKGNASTVAAVVVVAVNLEDNTRSVVNIITTDEVIRRRTSHLGNNGRVVPNLFPLFTSDPDMNIEISHLLTGQFVCQSASSSLIAGTTNEDGHVITVCQVPIPPFYGRLSGYLLLYSTNVLSIYEMDTLKQRSLKLAISIYYNDLVRTRMTPIVLPAIR